MTVAKDRKGNEYRVGDKVQMIDYPSLYETYNLFNRPMEIVDIEPFEACESGHVILLKDLQTGNIWKKTIDTNWIQKLKTTT
jgi:hypothetical protein